MREKEEAREREIPALTFVEGPQLRAARTPESDGNQDRAGNGQAPKANRERRGVGITYQRRRLRQDEKANEEGGVDHEFDISRRLETRDLRPGRAFTFRLCLTAPLVRR